MKFLSILMLLVLMSCGKAPEMKTPEPRTRKNFETLSGKEQKEILSLKYNNNIQLQCTLRVSDGTKINFSEDPVDTLAWDMPGESSLLKIMHFQLGPDPYVIVVKITEPLKILDHLTYSSPDGREYFMEHTPMLKIQYRRGPKSILTNGSVHEREAFTPVSLFENVEARLEHRSTEADDEKLVTEDFRCTLATTISSPYLSQWKIIK